MDSPTKPSSPTQTSATDLLTSSAPPESSIAPIMEDAGTSIPPPRGNRSPNPSDQRSPDHHEEEGGFSAQTHKVHSTDAPLERVQAQAQTLSHNSSPETEAYQQEEGEIGSAASSGYETPIEGFEEVGEPVKGGNAEDAPTGASGGDAGEDAPLASETERGASIAEEESGAPETEGAPTTEGASEEGGVQGEEEINMEEATVEEPLAAVAGLLPPSPEVLLKNLHKKKGARTTVRKGAPQGLPLQLNWRFKFGRPQQNPVTQHQATLQTPMGFLYRDKGQLDRYTIVSKITPTKFLCLKTLEELEIFEDVWTLLKRVGVYRLAHACRESRKELVVEFFSSAELEGEEDPKLKFRLGSRD